MLHQKIVKSVLNKHKQRDSWFLDDYSVNPYEGCSCNCLYCYIRGSKYGENMEEGFLVKTNALEVLEKQLWSRAKKNQYGIVAVGSATDAYVTQEEQWKLTEGILKLMFKYRFPVFVSTKRSLILRDIDLLKQIDKTAILPVDLKKFGRGAILSVSISTMNESIARMLEPGAIPPLERLQLLQQLKNEGFMVGVNAIPVLPLISDTEAELEKIISSAKEFNADYILVGSLTLFGNDNASSKTLYYKFLQRFYPDLIIEYDKIYAGNYFPPKKYQQLLKRKVDDLCKKYQIRNSILYQDVA
jgi:DNA repair photolyase